MGEPTLSTIKRLFSDAGRLCAFPHCQTSIVGANGTIIGEICHMKARNARGKRYDPAQSEAERHAYDNLLLLCPTHHKIIDQQAEDFPVERLQAMKAQAQAARGEPEGPGDAFAAAGLLRNLRELIITENSGNIAIDSPGAVQTTLVMKTTKNRPKIAPPAGSIGADGDARRYVKYLIDRYRDFAKGDPRRGAPFSHAVIYKRIQSEFGAQWELVSLTRFAALCAYLQNRIAKTSLGKITAAKGQALFSTFEQYLNKHGG